MINILEELEDHLLLCKEKASMLGFLLSSFEHLDAIIAVQDSVFLLGRLRMKK